MDPIKARRDLALALGADAALDPLAGDVGQRHPRIDTPRRADTASRPRRFRTSWAATPDRPTQWGHRGVDVAVEVSGNPAALHEAIRATRFGGTICVISFYGRDCQRCPPGSTSSISTGLRWCRCAPRALPSRDYPAWDLHRLADLGLRWLCTGRVRTEGIVSPIVPFDESAAAYAAIDRHPEQSIKLGITFP